MCSASTAQIDQSTALTVAAPRVLRLLPDGERLWLGTTSGVWELDAGGHVVQVWTEANGLPSSVIYDLARDHDGVVWAATSGGPAHKSGERFEPVLDGLPSAAATTLLPLGSGALYLGTSRGIARLDGNRWDPVYETHEFGRDRVVAAAEGADGSAWFAKERAITIIAAAGRPRVLYRDPLNPDDAVTLPSTRAQALAFDVLGRLWLATDQGLTVLEGERVLQHERWRPGLWGVDGLPGSRVWSIWIDRDDTVWLTFGDGPDAGVVARRGRAAGEWERLQVGPDKPAIAVYALARDAAGVLWAATARGLCRFDGNRFVAWPLELAPPHATS